MIWKRILAGLGSRGDVEDTAGLRLNAAIEQVVDEINPRLRALPGYRRKLRPCVQRALEHCATLVSRLPPGVEVSSGSWGRDPRVRAFFSSADELRRVFSRSDDIQDFFERHADASNCVALLSMKRETRTTLGMELHGEVIRRDVVQTAVSFTDHRVVRPSPGEPELRRELEERAFESLVGYALDRITRLLIARQVKEEQAQIARLQDRVAHVRAQGLATLLTDDGGDEGRNRQVGDHPPLDTLDDYVARIADVLGRPEDYFRLAPLTLHLNQMNILLEGKAARNTTPLVLCEASLGEHLRRILIIARFPRQDLLARRGFLEYG